MKLLPPALVTFKVWEQVLWIVASNVVLLAWVPFVIAFNRRFPLEFSKLRKHLAYHVLATVIYCITHVVAMVGLYELGYWAAGRDYVMKSWPDLFSYQYLKDFRDYFFIVVAIYFYRLVLARMQGEAKLLVAPESGSAVEPIERPERFLVRKMGKEFLLPASDIEWIQACGNYVNLRVRGHDYPLRSTMTAIEARLDPKRFMRVHRSYIANLDLIREIEMLDSGDARTSMIDGSQIPVSRRYLDQLRKTSAA